MLVVRRKSGQSIEITHGGETMVIEVKSSSGKSVVMSIDAPLTFRIERAEKSMANEVGLDCIVRDASRDASVKGVVLSVYGSGEEKIYRVKSVDGTIADYFHECVTILNRS